MADIRPLSPGQLPPEVRQARLKKATEDFEALFLSQMWKQMRQGVGKEGLFSSKEAESYLSMFDQEMGVTLAQAGGIGLAEMLSRQLQAKLERAGQGVAPAKPLAPLRPRTSMASAPLPPAEDAALAQAEALAERIVAEKNQRQAADVHPAGPTTTPLSSGSAEDAARPVATASLPSEGIWLTW